MDFLTLMRIHFGFSLASFRVSSVLLHFSGRPETGSQLPGPDVAAGEKPPPEPPPGRRGGVAMPKGEPLRLGRGG